MVKFVTGPPSTETVMFVSLVDCHLDGTRGTAVDGNGEVEHAVEGVGGAAEVHVRVVGGRGANRLRSWSRSTLTVPVTAPPDKARTSVAAGVVSATL